MTWLEMSGAARGLFWLTVLVIVCGMVMLALVRLTQ